MNQHVGAGASVSNARPVRSEGPSTPNFSAGNADGIAVVGFAGAIDSRAAGQVYDTLVQCVVEGRPGLVVDLTDVTHVTHAGVRGLIVAARLMKPSQGGMRICGASRSVEAVLRGLGFNHLLKIDATLEGAMAALAGPAARIGVGQGVAARQPSPRVFGNGQQDAKRELCNPALDDRRPGVGLATPLHCRRADTRVANIR